MSVSPTGTISSHSPADLPAGALLGGLEDGLAKQMLLGVTGSGKTYTMANAISAVQRSTLILAHNKTLAAQLYGEIKALREQGLELPEGARDRTGTL